MLRLAISDLLSYSSGSRVSPILLFQSRDALRKITLGFATRQNSARSAWNLQCDYILFVSNTSFLLACLRDRLYSETFAVSSQVCFSLFLNFSVSWMTDSSRHLMRDRSKSASQVPLYAGTRWFST